MGDVSYVKYISKIAFILLTVIEAKIADRPAKSKEGNL